MKSIVSFDQAIGGDGAKLVGGLAVESQDLKLQVAVTYPIAKIVEPATAALDGALDKLKAAIPGNWDDPFIETIKKEYKEQLLKLISE